MAKQTPASDPVRPRRRMPPPPAQARTLDQLGRRVLRTLVTLAAVVLMIDALFGDRGFIETMRARRENKELAASIAQLKADNERLREQARRLREDPKAIEDLARHDLGLIRPGEMLFIVTDERKAPGSRWGR
jgi:cell division protein FtsB